MRARNDVTFNIKGYTDRRTQELLDRYQLVEKARHVKSGREVPVVGGVADMGSGTASRAGDTAPGTARIWPATAGAPFKLVSLRRLHDRRSTL